MDTTARQLARTLVALSSPLDPGTRWFMQLVLMTLITRITLEEMLRGGQLILAIQEALGVGRPVGGEGLSHDLSLVVSGKNGAEHE